MLATNYQFQVEHWHVCALDSKSLRSFSRTSRYESLSHLLGITITELEEVPLAFQIHVHLEYILIQVLRVALVVIGSEDEHIA